MDKIMIALIGMTGVGKTTVGKAAATALGIDFYDVDELIISEHGNIADIFTFISLSFLRMIYLSISIL